MTPVAQPCLEMAKSILKGYFGQTMGRFTTRDAMPLNHIVIVDIFYVSGIDFMRSFLNEYVLLCVLHV